MTKIKELAKQELARIKYQHYVEYVHNGGWKPYPHVKKVCDKLEDVIAGRTKRLMIFMPPQHGKSMTVTETFPSYFLGKFPDKRIIEISYNDSFAVKFGMRNKNKVKAFGKQLFGIETTREQSSKSDWALAGSRGGMLSVGIGGGITGNPADLIIIDDPIKNSQDAASPTYRDRNYEEYRASALTRLQPDGAIIIIQTRWHEDDLSGRILTNEPGTWEVLNLPAICEDKNDILGRELGEPLWIDENKGRNKAWYEKTKREQGSYIWNALYQQRPAPVEGALFKREWWQYYKELPQGLTDYIQSWDCTFTNKKDSDYVVGQVWARKGSQRYLIDQVRARMSFTETIQAVRNLSAKHPKATRKLVENKANGAAVIDTLKKELTGLVPVEPAGGKEVRAHATTPLCEAGNIYIPEPKRANWIGDFVEECANFPNGSNDDQVDCLTQANIWYNEHKGNGILPEALIKADRANIWNF